MSKKAEKNRDKKRKKDLKTNKDLLGGIDRKPSENPEEENPFDFGGIPDRDLKKNLGCG